MANIKVKAAVGVDVPLDDGRVLKVGHGEVEVERTPFVLRRVMDGDLIDVTAADNEAATPVVEAKTKTKDK